MNIHEQIAELLDAGKPVYSFAAGRVGAIVKIDRTEDEMWPVTIQKRPGHTAATTFLAGDEVEIIKDGDAYKVVNTGTPEVDRE